LSRAADESTARTERILYKAPVLDNSEIIKDHYLLTFKPPERAPMPRPGQFYMAGVGTPLDPLLKRPFCFFRATGEGIQLLYRVRGKGTALLKDVRAGGLIDILGPLGRPYPMPAGKDRPLIVAGGTAVASVFPFVENLRGRARVIYGARGMGELLMLDELKAAALELHVATEDGSYGRKGTVMDILMDLQIDEDTALYACGPRGMTGAVAGLALLRGVRSGHVSLEEYMACGVGACMGCAVSTSKGYMRVCKEGPVFKIDEVAF
jgi:dihydroorotate dehydrogenase electron transfer subunit